MGENNFLNYYKYFIENTSHKINNIYNKHHSKVKNLLNDSVLRV